MSLISGSDDNQDKKSLSVDQFDSKSVTNSEEGIFNNFSFQKQIIQTKTEYVINKSALPDITIYPTNIHFNTTYPNKSLQSKIIISNSGFQTEDFNVALKGDPEFSISTQKISLSPGETKSLVIIFNPKKVSLFNSSLIFEGRISIVAPITGHCIPSPLEYPLINSPTWCFPIIKTEKLISFSNNSLSESLDVILSTNCMAFIVSPKKFDIPPSSSFDVNLSFDPSQQIAENPSLSIQCSQSGDSLTIPLIISPKKEKIVIDFGSVSIGRNSIQTLKLKQLQMAPIVQWPFAIENISDKGIPQDQMIFSFTAREIGKYRSKIHLNDFDIELRAASVDPPYRIRIPSHFPSHPLKIQNISESMLNLAFSLNTSSFQIDPETADLIPNQICELNIRPQNQSMSFSDDIVLKIIWVTNEDKRVVDEYQLPLNTSQSFSVINVENDDISNYSYSQRNKSSSKCKTEVNPNDIELTTNTSNFNSETASNSRISSNYNNQRNNIKSSNSSVKDKIDSISQTKNKYLDEYDDFDYYSSSSPKFKKNDTRSSENRFYSNKSVDQIKQSSSQQPKSNHNNTELDSFDYYEEDEFEVLNRESNRKSSTVSNLKKPSQNKYSVSLDSYDDNKRSKDYDVEYLSEEYPGSDSGYDDLEMKERNRTKPKRNMQEMNKRNDYNSQYSKHHHNHHHSHHQSDRNNRIQRRKINNKYHKHRNSSSKRNGDYYDYSNNEYSEYDYYDNETDYKRSKVSKSNHDSKSSVHNKYYPESVSSSRNERNIKKEFEHHNTYYRNDEYYIEEEEEDIDDQIQPQNKKQGKFDLKSYHSSNVKQLPESNNNASSSMIKAEDLKTQMTQTNAIGNGLQNLGSQTVDSFDEEMEMHTSKTQTSEIGTSTISTINVATSTIATSTNDPVNQNQSDLQNSKIFSFTSELTQTSQQSSRQVIPTSASFSFIPLFGVSPNYPSRFKITINSESGIEIEAPKWIKLPRSIQPNQSIQMMASSIPSETVLSTFSVHSESGDLSLPIIAYRGSSNLVLESEIEMIEITGDQYTASTMVKNNGERAGFIAFMLSESSSVNLRVSPPVAIIQPKSKIRVKFLVTAKSSEFTIPVVAYYGDEIVRQLQSIASPSDYLSTAFNEIENSNEISAFESIINDLNPRDILKIFRKSIKNSTLVFKSPNKSINLNRFTISPSSIEFLNKNEERKISLLNLSPKPLSFTVSASCYVSFSPKAGSAPPYGEAIITVSLSELNESFIAISVGNERYEVPLSISNTNDDFLNRKNHINKLIESNNDFTYQKKQIKNMNTNSGVFDVVDNEIEFDSVSIGKSKTLQFVVINNENYNMNLTLNSNNSAFVCDKKVILQPNNETYVDVTFEPKSIGVYEGNLLIRNDDHKIKLKLSGECVNDQSSVSSFISHPLEFPACIPQTIRRAQLRVSNRTDRFATITAITSPPFFCPYPKFEVDPFSYVLVPVRFIPKKAGEYSGNIEFHSSSGTVSSIELYGICVEA